MDGWPYEKELEQGPPAAEMMRNFEKQLNLAEQLTNSLDDHMKPADEYPEPLPTPQALKIQPFKKSNSQYRTLIGIMMYLLDIYCKRHELISNIFSLDMTICHFKICNMGRKRSATWDADMGRKRDTLHQRF